MKVRLMTSSLFLGPISCFHNFYFSVIIGIANTKFALVLIDILDKIYSAYVSIYQFGHKAYAMILRTEFLNGP